MVTGRSNQLIKQIVGEKKPLSVPQLVCVFVIAAEKYGEDQFFVLEWSKVQDILIENHKQWLNKHGGVRPRKPDSMHCALGPTNLHEYKDKWEVIKKRFAQDQFTRSLRSE